MIANVNPEWHKYLLTLKVTVEGLLVHQVPNVWSIYGGLNRLHVAVENIFKHGCKAVNEEVQILLNIWRNFDKSQVTDVKIYFFFDYFDHVIDTCNVCLLIQHLDNAFRIKI